MYKTAFLEKYLKFLYVNQIKEVDLSSLEQFSEQEFNNNEYFKLLFPHELEDVCSNIEQLRNQTLIKDNSSKLEAITKIREKIYFLTKARLETKLFNLEPEFLNQALYFTYIKPKNLLWSQKILWHCASEIWHFSGDNSTDLNYYSKRALLHGIYANSLRKYVNDLSPKKQETWDLLAQQIEAVMKIQQAKKLLNLKNLTNKLPFFRLFK